MIACIQMDGPATAVRSRAGSDLADDGQLSTYPPIPVNDSDYY